MNLSFRRFVLLVAGRFLGIFKCFWNEENREFGIMRSAKLSCERLLYTKHHKMVLFIAKSLLKVPLLRAAFHLKLPSLLGGSFIFPSTAEFILNLTTVNCSCFVVYFCHFCSFLLFHVVGRN